MMNGTNVRACLVLAAMFVRCMALGPGARAAEEILDEKLAVADAADGTRWFDIRHLDVEGRGWTDTKAPYDRLPAKAEGKVGDSWGLSRHSAGMCVRFVTDSPDVRVRWTLTSASLAMPHMAATGVSGVDLYAREAGGRWGYRGTGRPGALQNAATLATPGTRGKIEYLLYLPLYNGTAKAEIGVAKGAAIAKAPARPPSAKPVVFYGSSIAQGGCASRPGMAYPAILGRRLNRAAINLGFSGCGKIEPPMADLLAELDPAAFVIECWPNILGGVIAERFGPFIRTIAKAHPGTPVIVLEEPGDPRAESEKNRVLRRGVEELRAAGIRDVRLVGGYQQLGPDGEGTVDGCHPTDLGFVRMADAIEPALRDALEGR